MSSLVVTVVGPDRPGLVGQISDVIRQNGGNWLESRMSHLADQFAGILHVDVPADGVAGLAAALEQLESEGLQVVVRSDLPPAESAAAGGLWVLNVVGNDRPGIVREVTQLLASHEVNVEEFSTECSDAPHSGGRVFKAVATIRIPEGLSPELLQGEMERLATDLMIDLNAA